MSCKVVVGLGKMEIFHREWEGSTGRERLRAAGSLNARTTSQKVGDEVSRVLRADGGERWGRGVKFDSSTAAELP